MSLSEWQSNGWLRSHRSSDKELAGLFSIVDRDLQDANSSELSSDWQFGIAYNAALKLCMAICRARRDASNIRMRSELAAGNIVSHQAEMAVGQSLQARLGELLTQRDACMIRSQADGQVVAKSIHERIGQYCREGCEVCQIVDPQSKELLVSISQADRKAFVDRQGESVRFLRKAWLPEMHGLLERVNPHAKTETDARLTAAGGGPLVQRQTGDEMLLVQPRFEATVDLEESQATRLAAGMTGNVRLNAASRSIAGEIWHRVLAKLQRVAEQSRS